MPELPKDLEPVSDLKMIQRYLKYGIEFHEPASCLLAEGKLNFEAQLKSMDEKNLVVDLDLTEDSFKTLSLEQLKQLEIPQGEIRISYSVNEATFFLHGRIQGRQANRIVVKASLPMYKLQRREALRIKVMENHKAYVVLGQDLKMPLFDISAGGVSFLVTLEKSGEYKKGQLFSNSTLSFIGKEIKVNLEVQNILQHGKEGMKFKVGLKFKGLPASVEQMIAKEAYLHTHKIWSRWL
jgi:c-di-GMP-binding flagellar brake protein YcgR